LLFLRIKNNFMTVEEIKTILNGLPGNMPILLQRGKHEPPLSIKIEESVEIFMDGKEKAVLIIKPK